MVILSLSFFFVNNKLFSIMLNMWTMKLYIFIKNRIADKEAIPTGTASVKKGIFFLNMISFHKYYVFDYLHNFLNSSATNWTFVPMTT